MTDGMGNPAPQERQRVGCELRAYRGTQYMETFAHHMDRVFYLDGTESFKAVAHALAGYIDPTCHVEPFYAGAPGDQLFKCSACHTPWTNPSRVRYCPNCGARRIFDDEIAYSTGGDE